MPYHMRARLKFCTAQIHRRDAVVEKYMAKETPLIVAELETKMVLNGYKDFHASHASFETFISAVTAVGVQTVMKAMVVAAERLNDKMRLRTRMRRRYVEKQVFCE